LPHGLNRSCGVSEPDEPTSVDGSVDGGGGGGAARVGEVGEGSGVGFVQGASGPWGQPLGPMVMRAVRRTAGTPMGPMTTVIRRSLASWAPWDGATRLGQAQPWTAHGTTRRLHRES
jgi:hypothetical protein